MVTLPKNSWGIIHPPQLVLDIEMVDQYDIEIHQVTIHPQTEAHSFCGGHPIVYSIVFLAVLPLFGCRVTMTHTSVIAD